MTNAQRTFATCLKCESAVLKGFLQASGLCKVCDAKRLKEKVQVRAEAEILHNNEANVADYGLERDVQFDGETGEWFTVDEEGNREVVEVESTNDDLASLRRKSQRLDKAADALIEAADQKLNQTTADFAAWAAWYCALKETNDVIQALANKHREGNYLELRNVKEDFQLATASQQAALVKLGWDKDEIRNMRLTVAEASRLLQRGPKWVWCK